MSHMNIFENQLYHRSNDVEAAKIKSKIVNTSNEIYKIYPQQQSNEYTDPSSGSSEGNLNDEIQRIRTFYEWPSSAPVTPYELAKWGFIYLKTGDKVKCVYCGQVIHNWQPGDTVFGEHKRLSPHCPLIIKNSDPRAPSPRGVDVSSRSQPNTSSYNQATTATNAARFCDSIPVNAKFPEYKEIHKRIRSYAQHHWRETVVTTPRELSECGFFYTGEADKVKCFVCGGNLQGWVEGDKPWEEHVKWYPHCELVKYVQENKNRNVTSQQSPTPRRLVARGATSTVPSGEQYSAQSRASTSNTRGFSKREVRARLDTPLVRTVLQKGFSKESVTKAIERQLNTKGDDFPSAADLLGAVLDIESELLEDEQSSQIEFSGPGTVYKSPQSSTSYSGASYNAGGTVVNVSGSTGSKQVYATNKHPGYVSVNTPVATVNVSGSGNTNVHAGPSGATTGAAHGNDEYKSLEDQLSELKEERMCKICMDRPADVVFLPCGHFVCCSKCASMVRQCPICRQNIQNVVKTFVS